MACLLRKRKRPPQGNEAGMTNLETAVKNIGLINELN